MDRPRVVVGERAGEPADPRVSAVLEVLGGRTVPEVAARWNLDVALLHRWVRAFVAAGTAQVTNRPEEDEAQHRDRFLAAFAHETRTPLAVARGWVTMLRDGSVPPDRVGASLDTLDDALQRLTERILDVELLATASLGRLGLSPELVAVSALVEGLPDLGEVEGGATQALVDPTLFRRVLRDLWAAAATAPAPRHRRVVVRRVEPWVEVTVVRDADPIDPALLRALFEPFDLNDDGTGVTIGLYLARALTVAHGGTVGVDQDDDGAALWVRIPDAASDGEDP